MASYRYSGNDIVYDDRGEGIAREEKRYHPYGEERHEVPPPYVEDKQHGAPTYDDPFGDEEFAEVKYRTLRWW